MPAQTRDRNRYDISLWKAKSELEYLHIYSAKVEESSAYFPSGSGASTDEPTAKFRAIYEAIERHSGSTIPRNLLSVPYANIANEALDPSKLIPFSPKQYTSHDFPYQRIGKNTEIEWKKGISLTNNREIYIPAFAIYLGYNRKTTKNGPFCPTISSGLAVQKSLEEAVIKGVTELVERDSAMLVWLTKKKTPRLNLLSVEHEATKKLIKNIRKNHLKAEVVISTSDIPVQSVIGIIYNTKNASPCVGFGMAAGFNIEELVMKSLEEALMVWDTLNHCRTNDTSIHKHMRPSQVKTLLDHALYYSSPDNSKRWKFLLSGDTIKINDLKVDGRSAMAGNLKNIVNAFAELDFEIFAVDLTTDLARSLKLKCVRVTIPGLKQQEIDHNKRFLGPNRGINSIEIVNNFPHPFS